MENQSQNQARRRHRGNRSGGRSRNRQGNQSRQEGKSQNGGRSRNRNRGGSRSRPPKQTLAQKILGILTFGLLGKPKPKSRSASGKSNPTKGRQPVAKPTRTTEEPKKAKRSNRAEVTSARLYVGNLDYSTGEAELEDLFKGAGNVLSAEVVTNPRTQQSKGFAFVEMGSIDEAKRAVETLDDQEFMGRRLVVSGARSEGAPSDEDGALVAADSRG